MKIDIHDNYVCSELNFFYFRKATYLIFKLYTVFNFETLYIKFQEEFLKFAFFQKLVLKLKNMIYFFTCMAYFLRYRTCCFRKLTNFSKKKKV